MPNAKLTPIPPLRLKEETATAINVKINDEKQLRSTEDTTAVAMEIEMTQILQKERDESVR